MLGYLGPYEIVIIAAVLLIVALVAYLIFRDARKRGISDFAAMMFVLLVVFMFPIGVLLYITFALGRGKQVRGSYDEST